MKIKKHTIVFTALIISAIASFLLVIIKDQTYFHSPPYSKNKKISSDVLVVYFSRSGNTEAMAREIARKFNADIIKLLAPKYPLDIKGWRTASKDADKRVVAVEIEPETVDMERYKLIFLGSPIWWFRPAPPLWTFVQKNDFKGKNVILFNTFNSRFKSEEIDVFKQWIAKKEGRFVEHIYVRRGRVYYQKSGESLMKEAKEILESRQNEWKNFHGK